MRNTRQGAIPSELGWLIDTLDGYEARLRTLEAPSGENLSATVARLQQLVKPVTIYRREDPAPITAVASAVAAVATPVPAGYTRALVHVTASATLRSNEAAGVSTLFMCAAIVAASGGTFYNQWGSVDGQKYGGVQATSAVVVEGLAPGATVDVHALVSFPGAYTIGRASVAGSILFLR
ncbi:hypothetical protein MIC448_320009 [Microbacterium sp. C448]|uniref:hypothetical protein n=1 Tax=Microbacterium sp. C448 TaxID=1177594 RepID=UPI0003DE200E|nr:hypothetical protein [Microbacterium sp. C448]CDK00705.1 hypothetical protein MIC448_320009 [Microbacterium sp. C448]